MQNISKVFVRDGAGCKMFGFLCCGTGLPFVSVAATRCALCFAWAVRQCRCSYHCGYYFVFRFRIAADMQSWLVLNETAKVLYPNTVFGKVCYKITCLREIRVQTSQQFHQNSPICTRSPPYATFHTLPQIIQDIFPRLYFYEAIHLQAQLLGEVEAKHSFHSLPFPAKLQSRYYLTHTNSSMQ